MEAEAEAIVVLGARVLADGTPGPALARRIRHARLLREARPGALVIASGGPAGAVVTEAAAIALALGAGGAVIVEDRSRDTVENARFVAALMRARGLRRALVVSDRYHLPRALLLFRLLGVEARGSGPDWGAVGGLDAGQDASPGAGPDWRPLRRTVALMREAAALPVSVVRVLAGRRGG